MIYASLLNDLKTRPLKVLLAGPGYEPDPGDTLADIPEIEGEGYAKGGLELRGRFLWEEDGKILLRASNLKWLAARFAARWAVLYFADTREIIASWDLGEQQGQGGTFELAWAEQGILCLE